MSENKKLKISNNRDCEQVRGAERDCIAETDADAVI